MRVNIIGNVYFLIVELNNFIHILKAMKFQKFVIDKIIALAESRRDVR